MHNLTTLAAAGASTTNLQDWIKHNVVPLLILMIAVVLLLLAQKGDNSRAMRVVAGVVIALVVLGVAATGKADSLGAWLSGLVTG